MKSVSIVFNGFLALLLIGSTAGCLTTEERKHLREFSSLRIHVEADRGSADRNSAIAVHRAHPMFLNIDREPVLDERYVVAATVLEQPGDLFAIEVKFDRRGSWILERTSVMNRGKHLAVFSDFGDQTRWLAAPEMVAKNSSGRLVFTPDATREEAKRIVRGLNNVAKSLENQQWLPSAEPVDR